MRKKVIAALIGTCLLAAVLGSLAYRHFHRKSAATLAAKESAVTEQEGAGETPPEGEEPKEEEVYQENRQLVGILLPQNADDENGKRDAKNMQDALTEAGYLVRTMFANGYPSVQSRQLKFLVREGAKALIVAPVDGESLVEGLAQAKDAGVGIFSYEGLLMDTPNVNFFLTFDRRQIAAELAGELAKRFEMALETEGEHPSYTLEFDLGEKSMEGLFFFEALKEELEGYFAEGWLTVPSGKMAYEDVTRNGEDQSEGEFPDLEGTRSKWPDIFITGDTGIAMDILSRLEESHLPREEWPFVTSIGVDEAAMKALSEEKLSLTYYLDEAALSKTCAQTVDTYLKGEDPEVSNYGQYDNGVRLIKTITVDPLMIDPTNYLLLIDNGAFEETVVFPNGRVMTPTPTLAATQEEG